MSHTPGPWRHDSKDDCIIASDDTHVVCFGHDYDDYGGIYAPYPATHEKFSALTDMEKRVHDEEVEANARLIAAAPDMLAELKRILEYGSDTGADLERLEAVIKKAEGR